MACFAHAGPVAQAALAIGFALVMAPVVWSVTDELNNTVGRAWPFSLVRCVSPATPGCGPVMEWSAEGRPGAHLRTGRL